MVIYIKSLLSYKSRSLRDGWTNDDNDNSNRHKRNLQISYVGGFFSKRTTCHLASLSPLRCCFALVPLLVLMEKTRSSPIGGARDSTLKSRQTFCKILCVTCDLASNSDRIMHLYAGRTCLTHFSQYVIEFCSR